MANGRMSCPVCSFELAAGTRFCGECGAAIPEELAQARAKPAPTILGIDAEAVQLAAAAAQAAAAAEASQRPEATPSSRDAEAARADDLKASLSPPARGTGSRASLSAPPAPLGSEAVASAALRSTPARALDSAPAAASGAADKPLSRTRLDGSDAGSAADKSLGRARLDGSDAGSAADKSLGRARLDGSDAGSAADKSLGRARQGGAESSDDAPLAASAVPNLEARAAAQPAPRNWGHRTALGWGEAPLSSAPPSKVMHGRTMLGVPLAAISPSLAPHARDVRPQPVAAADTALAHVSHDDAAEVATAETSGTRPTSPESLEPPNAVWSAGTRALLGGFIAGIVLIALGTFVYVRMAASHKGLDVRARITSEANAAGQSEILQFEVPAAAEGAKLRFGGQEQPIVGGRATFPLASDSLRVGDNVVLAEVVEPSGEHTSARIVIALAYRLWVDTSGLLGTRPSIDVKVAALPGTRVFLDDAPLELEPRDGQVHGSKTYPLEAPHGGKGGPIEHVVAYRIEPPNGEPVTDQLHTRIPIAVLQIDRPGADLITDSDTVEIAGSVGRDTGVSVDGRQVPVKDGRFVQRLALPKPGEYKPRVTAGAEGKLPVSVTLNIRRVRDLAQAAREFSFDKNLTYAKLATAANNYRGEPIAIEGRVYAVDSRAGSSVVQMLARPCPGAQRCSLWVVDPQARELAVDRFVRVLGVVDGEQQFRSENNQIVTVPKVIAQFILPARP